MSFPAQQVAEAAWEPAGLMPRVRGAPAARLVLPTLKRVWQMGRRARMLRLSRQTRVRA
jgi:hypothetical protein